MGEKKTPPALFTRMLTGPSSAIVRARAASTSAAVADVGGEAEPTDLLRRRHRSLGVAFPDRHRGAEGGETAGDAPADPRSAAGHDSHLVGEQH